MFTNKKNGKTSRGFFPCFSYFLLHVILHNITQRGKKIHLFQLIIDEQKKVLRRDLNQVNPGERLDILTRGVRFALVRLVLKNTIWMFCLVFLLYGSVTDSQSNL